jgi:hypothetical protein
MTLFDVLRRFFGRPSAPRPACRLTEAQTLEIAGGVYKGRMPLYVQGVVQTEDGVEWRINTATVGSGVAIRISDATGEVLDCRGWGVR